MNETRRGTGILSKGQVHEMEAKSFYREKRIKCGNIDYVGIYKVFDGKQRGKRIKRQKSTLKQIQQNDKNARKRFIQLVNANFGKKDYVVHLTYKPKFLPKTIEEAERNVKKYIRRLQYKYRKYNREPRYMVVSEYLVKADGTITRFHHHIIIDGFLSRDEIENTWRVPRKKGEKEGESLGYANCQRLQPNEFGLEALAKYLTKGLTSKKRWHSSKNLKQPIERKNDYKWSQKKTEHMAGLTDDFSLWRKIYPGYRVIRGNSVFNENTGWKIELILRKDGTDDYFFHHSRDATGT